MSYSGAGQSGKLYMCWGSWFVGTLHFFQFSCEPAPKKLNLFFLKRKLMLFFKHMCTFYNSLTRGQESCLPCLLFLKLLWNNNKSKESFKNSRERSLYLSSNSPIGFYIAHTLYQNQDISYSSAKTIVRLSDSVNEQVSKRLAGWLNVWQK